VKGLAERWEELADTVLGVAASVILFCMMTLTFVDVVMRYILSSPVRGATEVTELMLLVLIFAGLPLVSHADEHVTMDFIDKWLPARATDLLERAVHVLCACVMAFLAWQVWIKAGKIAAVGAEGEVTQILRVPIARFVYFMAAMIALAGLVHLFKVFVPGRKRAAPGTA
jgi:TRAP-type C4-dicarboxylate transport system permease small subunit